MKRAGYATKYGEYKNWSSIRNILRNPTYTGQIHFGEIIIDDAFEAIIDKERFQTVQKLIVDRARPESVTPLKSNHLPKTRRESPLPVGMKRRVFGNQ